MTFKTKRDSGITLIFLLLDLWLVGMGIYFLVTEQIWSMFVFFIFFSAFLSWILLDIKYVFNKNNLFVKAAFIRLHISYANMVKVSKTTDSLTGTRLTGSTDSIELFYKKKASYKSVKISPQPKEEFLKELKTRSPNIRIDNSCWGDIS